MKNKKKSLMAVIMICTAVLFCLSMSTKHYVNSESNADKVIGVWKLISPALSDEGNQQKVKIITKGHFIWTHTYNDLIALSLAGTYTLDGNTYTEFIKNAIPNQSSLIGFNVACELRFEDNKMYVTSLPGEIMSFSEIWERLE